MLWQRNLSWPCFRSKKCVKTRDFFLWRFGFALLIVVMPFGFVLFVTTHLSLQYENSIQTKFEVFVCYLPEVLNVQTDIFSTSYCFFRMNFVLLWHWHFYVKLEFFCNEEVGLGFKCCMKITKQLCTSYKVFKGVENSEHCRTI